MQDNDTKVDSYLIVLIYKIICLLSGKPVEEMITVLNTNRNREEESENRDSRVSKAE